MLGVDLKTNGIKEVVSGDIRWLQVVPRFSKYDHSIIS